MENGEGGGKIEGLRIDRARLAGRRRWTRRALSVVVLFVLATIALSTVLRRPPEIAVAAVREARPGEARTQLSASGYVASRRRSVVAPKIPGRLEKVLVEEGQRVAEGDVLAKLDDDDARVAVQQAEADLRAARAQVTVSRWAAEKAKRDLERSERLFGMGAIAGVEVQDAKTTATTADDMKRAAEARVGAAEAALAASRLRLDQTVVRAPFAGTVVRKLADEGAVLAPASITQMNVGGIVELVDLDALEVEAEVSEDELAKIHEGQPALITLDAYPDVVYRGTTGTVRPAIDRSKATAVVKVRFVDPPKNVLPDMAAKVSFLSSEIAQGELDAKAQLRVPASAVVERNGESVVFVVKDGRLTPQPVRVAERLGDEVVITAGPPPGTRIAAAPKPRLRAGQRVRVKEAAQ